nr:MAG TPA: Major capsid protein [Microviridae sp.]
MGKQPFISHAVNGYSRYDVPESKAFTCTPGILYPVRIDFINSRDRVSIEQGIDVRSNPLAVPTFNPYTIRLHRFWVPLQLYHPEMRTNSSKFDMNDLSFNWIPVPLNTAVSGAEIPSYRGSYSNSLFFWLRVAMTQPSRSLTDTEAISVSIPSVGNNSAYFNADSYLAYWDIVRNYYGYSQWSLFSFAWPGSSYITEDGSGAFTSAPLSTKSYFSQRYGNLEYLDSFYESQFYPAALTSLNNSFNRAALYGQIITSDIEGSGASGDGFPVFSLSDLAENLNPYPASQFSTTPGTAAAPLIRSILKYHPMAVVPSNPDRFSRLLPSGDSTNVVSMSGVSTIPQLAIASRLQEYKDLLGAGGSRYSDWLETFFASKIEHVDRPKLLFSASQTVNVQIVMNQAGFNNFGGDSSSGPLGQQGGAIAFNERLGRRQSYYFREPGYMIDMLSIRPVYYWAGIRPDYLKYNGPDYFNPIYNDIGYQDVSTDVFGQSTTLSTIAREPCFNEFRSSYDEVLGQLSVFSAVSGNIPLYSYWVQQRYSSALVSGTALPSTFMPSLLFVDMAQVNSPFFSKVEDNFFVNLSYAVQKKNLVNKTFATRLSNR